MNLSAKLNKRNLFFRFLSGDVVPVHFSCEVHDGGENEEQANASEQQ